MFRRAALPILALLLLSSIILNASIDAQFGSSPMKTAKACLNENVVNPGESIQDAIDKACANATILVKCGKYHEHVNVTKPVKLIGEDSRATIIDGGGENKTIVNVIASNVEIRCFTVRNGSRYYPGYGYGIQVMNNLNVTIRGNVIREISVGIFLSNSNSCHIIGNTITGNYYYGIQLSDSRYNRVVGNNIVNNSGGVWITSAMSRANILYHNNLINNTDHAPLPRGNATRWDDGAEGNYWSDYTGDDLNGDGIGDTPYPEDWPQFAFDKRPLMGMFSDFNILWEESYQVTTICNSTISEFRFDNVSRMLSFNVAEEDGTTGFCRVAIPSTLFQDLWGDNCTVFIDDEPVEFKNWTDGTNAYLYFTYIHSEHQVTIIPEFPTTLFLLIFVIASLIAIIFVKRSNKLTKVKDLGDSCLCRASTKLIFK